MTHTPYAGPAIYDDSPRHDIVAALAAAETHPDPAVRYYLRRSLTLRLARARVSLHKAYVRPGQSWTLGL